MKMSEKFRGQVFKYNKRILALPHKNTNIDSINFIASIERSILCERNNLKKKPILRKIS